MKKLFFFAGLAAFYLAAALPSLKAIDIGTMTWTPRSDWINVKSAPYNATGNGVTDDTAAIQAALTAIHNAYVFQAPAVLYFPPGTYKISSTLQLKATSTGTYGGFSMVGCGSATIIQWASTGTPGLPMADDNAVSGLICTGLTWDGNNVANCAYFLGASAGYESPVRHENESFRNFTVVGTYASASPQPPGTAIIEGVPGGYIASEVMIHNCRFSNCTIGVACSFQGYDNYMWCIDGCEFDNCGVGFSGGGGINEPGGGAADYTITNTHFQGSTIADIGGETFGAHIRHCTSSGSAVFANLLGRVFRAAGPDLRKTFITWNSPTNSLSRASDLER